LSATSAISDDVAARQDLSGQAITADVAGHNMPPARAWVAPLEESGSDPRLLQKDRAEATVIRRRSKRVNLAVPRTKMIADGISVVSTPAQRQVLSRKKLSIRSR